MASNLEQLETSSPPAAALLDFLTAVAGGLFPPADGCLTVLPSPRGPCDAVLGFTGHAVVAAPVSEEWVRGQCLSDQAGLLRPAFVGRLAAEIRGEPGGLNLLLAASGLEGPAVWLVPTRPGESRARRTRHGRTQVTSYADGNGHGRVDLGIGLAGRREISIELAAASRSRGHGRALIEAARMLIPRDEYLFASPAVGDAQSLRAFLAAGFAPIGAEVLFRRSSEA